MEVVLIGTGTPLPDPTRAGPATLVRAGASTFVIDCGRGVLMRMAAAGATISHVTALLLTHLHSDHIADLVDVVATRWAISPGPDPLPIIGPPRTSEVVLAVRAALGPDVDYRRAHHPDLTYGPEAPVTELTSGVAWEAEGVRVVAAPTEHKPVAASVAYRIEHGGDAVVVAGDTLPCDALDGLCAGADVLVHTVIRDELLRAFGIERLAAVCDYHSTVAQAAATAERTGVKTLVLTHQVPSVAPGTEDEWRALAAEHFDGKVVVGSDLTVVVT